MALLRKSVSYCTIIRIDHAAPELSLYKPLLSQWRTPEQGYVFSFNYSRHVTTPKSCLRNRYCLFTEQQGHYNYPWMPAPSSRFLSHKTIDTPHCTVWTWLEPRRCTDGNTFLLYPCLQLGMNPPHISLPRMTTFEVGDEDPATRFVTFKHRQPPKLRNRSLTTKFSSIAICSVRKKPWRVPLEALGRFSSPHIDHLN